MDNILLSSTHIFEGLQWKHRPSKGAKKTLRTHNPLLLRCPPCRLEAWHWPLQGDGRKRDFCHQEASSGYYHKNMCFLKMFLTVLNIGTVPAHEALHRARAKNPGNKSKIFLPLHSERFSTSENWFAISFEINSFSITEQKVCTKLD